MTLGNYKLFEKLGEGGMATVYLANHELLGSKVAIKLLSEDYLSNKNIRNRFLAEARSLASMSHRNIIKVTDLIDQPTYVAFVMEYVDGITLKDYIEQKVSLTNTEIKTIFFQMLEAVGYVHEQKLVHRDIKPTNFMIDSNGDVKLLDFGIAKNTNTASFEYTQTGTMQNMGTPMYMSPEQVKSTKDVTLQSDIYSLGVVLWQMVMGKKPYDTSSLSGYDLNTKIIHEQLPDTNSLFANIIKRATAKNVVDRYANVASIISEIKMLSFNNNVENSSVEVFKKNQKNIISSDSITKVESFQTGIVSINGTETSIVKVGSLAWSMKNLEVSNYRNGDLIAQASDYETLKNLTTGAWCYYEFKETNGAVYGKLYNWYAVNDPRGIAPEGFHVAETVEWENLIYRLDGEFKAGGKLKVKGSKYWVKPNVEASNFVNFSALPGGGIEGWAHKGKGVEGNWWTATERDHERAWVRCIDHNGPEINKYSLNKKCFFSVRCILNENQNCNIYFKRIESIYDSIESNESDLVKPQTKKNQRNSKNINQVVTKSNGVKVIKKRNIANDIIHDLDQSIDMEKKSDKFLTVFLPVLLSIILLYLLIKMFPLN